ncbi:MAG TPA: type II toxin-antitoxin system MqsA family antitoxin [Aquabacterium sp.]|nr:type II toxin-antitoxin system MqsA family antitoxin [Aquabacterium sp.]HQC94918.1 type II toxin-antitoxin system MqsA family antitoxin [Aquabacterium sp.]
MTTTTLPKCPVCRKGQLLPSTTQRAFHPRGALVSVELLASECNHCGKQTIRASQHEENLRRLDDRKNRPEYEGLLLGEQILALRHRYGLKQQDASKIFGKGKIAFSRYENEVTYPDDSTTLLLRMAIDKPDCMKWLAEQAKVELPLWEVRCEESKLSVRKVPATPVIRLVSERVDVVAPRPQIERNGDLSMPYAA